MNFQGKKDFNVVGDYDDIFLADCHNVTIKVTARTVHLLNCTAIRLHDSRIDAEGRDHAVTCLACHDIEIARTRARRAKGEVVWIGPGNAYQRLDGHLWGEPYQVGASFKNPGFNVLAFSGDHNQIRGGSCIDGKVTGVVEKDEKGYFWRSAFKTDHQKLSDLEFFVRYGEKLTFKAAFISATDETIELLCQDCPDGEIVWYGIDTRYMSRHIHLHDLIVDGSELNSGITCYGCDGVTAQSITTHNTRDYGVGFEWCQNVAGSDIRVSGTGDNWNRIEVVYFARNIDLANSSRTGLRPHGAPCLNVSTLNTPCRLEYDPNDLGSKGIDWFDNVQRDTPMNHKSIGVRRLTPPAGPSATDSKT